MVFTIQGLPALRGLARKRLLFGALAFGCNLFHPPLPSRLQTPVHEPVAAVTRCQPRVIRYLFYSSTRVLLSQEPYKLFCQAESSVRVHSIAIAVYRSLHHARYRGSEVSSSISTQLPRGSTVAFRTTRTVSSRRRRMSDFCQTLDDGKRTCRRPRLFLDEQNSEAGRVTKVLKRMI